MSKKGETNIAKNGQKMTIIAYRGYSDIDVQFEDNVIVFHKSYSSFKNGNIKNPNKNIIKEENTDIQPEKKRLTVNEFNEEIKNGILNGIMFSSAISVKDLLEAITNGSCKIEDYGQLDVIQNHILSPCGFHIEIVED